MSEQTSRLAIILDSTGAKRNAESLTDALVRLTTGGEKTVAAVGKLGGALATAVAAGALSAASAVAVMVKQTADAGVEIGRFSKIANASSTDFQRYAVAASAAGISQEKFSDIMKDVNDKVGDFLSTGGGELQNFFTKIAPQVGVTAKQFENLSGPQAMQLYVSSLEKANVSQAQMTFYMEAIANDATALVPMFQNGGKAAGELADMAQKLGLILDQKTIKAAQELEATGWLASSALQGMKNQIAAGLMPAISDLTSDMVGFVAQGVDMSAVSETMEDWLKRLARAGVTAAGAFMGVSKGISGMVSLWDGVKDIDLSHPIDAYGQIKNVYANVSKETDSQLDGIQSWVNKSLDAINKAGNAGGNVLVKNIAEWRSKANQLSKGSYFPGENGQQKKGSNQADAGQRMIQQLTEQHNILLQQEKTGQAIGSQEQASIKWATELADLKQKKNLSADEKSLLVNEKTITALVNQNKETEKAIKLQEQQQKITAFHQQLLKETSQFTDSLNAQLAGGDLGSKQQQRVQELLAIRQEFSQKQSDLTDTFNNRSSGMSETEYQQETQMISAELQKRLTAQQGYYNDLDRMNANWETGVSQAWSDYKDSAADMASMSKNLVTNAFGSMEDSLVAFTTTGKLSFKGFADSLIQDMARISARMAISGLASSVIGGVSSLFGSPSTAGNAGTALSGNGALGLSTSYTSYLRGGYDGGGFTGEGGKYDPAGIVHKGEFVFTKEATSRIGKDNLAKLMKGYSSGGYVGAPTAPLSSKRQQPGANGGFSMGDLIINVDSNGNASATSTADGQGIAKQIQQSVVNAINEQATKQGTPLWRAIKGR